MSESLPVSGYKIYNLLKGEPDTDPANTNDSIPRTIDSRNDAKCTDNHRTTRATPRKSKGRCTFMRTCVMVSYYVILLTAIRAKLIPQSYLTDTYDSPANVTLVLDNPVTDKLHVTPSIGPIASKIYLRGHYHSTHSYKTLSLCIIVLSGDIELNPGPNSPDPPQYPCSMWRNEARDNDPAIPCDQCHM